MKIELKYIVVSEEKRPKFVAAFKHQDMAREVAAVLSLSGTEHTVYRYKDFVKV